MCTKTFSAHRLVGLYSFYTLRLVNFKIFSNHAGEIAIYAGEFIEIKFLSQHSFGTYFSDFDVQIHGVIFIKPGCPQCPESPEMSGILGNLAEYQENVIKYNQ